MPAPPQSPAGKQRQFWFRAMVISVIGVAVPPLIGLAGTIIGTSRAFNTLGATGEADPTELARNISTAVLTTAIGLTVSLIFLFALIISAIRFYRLKKQHPPQ